MFNTVINMLRFRFVLWNSPRCAVGVFDSFHSEQAYERLTRNLLFFIQNIKYSVFMSFQLRCGIILKVTEESAK